VENKAGNPKTIRENNQKVLAQYLFKHGTTSRAKLSNVFQLSSPSVYKNIAQLIEQNVVLEIGEGGSEGGRRPMLISFNYNMGYIVSMDLKGEYLKLVLANLALTIIGREDIRIRDYQNGQDLFVKTIEIINDLMQKNNINHSNLLSIVMGVPGSVNQQTGEVNMPPIWFNVGDLKRIEDLISKAYPTCKIVIKNDINLAAIGEMRYGIGKGFKNLIYISVDMGVGAGIIIEGKLYEGSRFSSGEIGYSRTSLQAKKTLEDEISIRAITEYIKDHVGINQDGRAQRFLSKDQKTINITEVNNALANKDEDLLSIMEDVTSKLGLILSNICALLDIEMIIIGGKIVDFDYNIKAKLDQILKDYIPIEVKTGFSSLNDDEIILGGFALSLDEILKEIAIF
jgi:predicted NBD/HSP70 family sugar kinase